jgi:hypothetical protein
VAGAIGRLVWPSAADSAGWHLDAETCLGFNEHNKLLTTPLSISWFLSLIMFLFMFFSFKTVG